jgi:uncharacterized membrane protein YhaH (DUF805 family)
MGPFRAIGSCYAKIVTFSGRARRAEYWWFALYVFLASMIIQGSYVVMAMRDPMLAAAMSDPAAMQAWLKSEAMTRYTWLFTLGYLLLGWLPQMSAMVRRLHDTDRSGWFFFMPIVVTVGAVIAAFMVLPGLAGTALAMPLMLGIVAVPVLANLWFLIVLCLPGTSGPNRFGPDPIEGRRAREADHPAFAARLEPADQAALEAQRKAEIKNYYRTRVLPGIQKA